VAPKIVAKAVVKPVAKPVAAAPKPVIKAAKKLPTALPAKAVAAPSKESKQRSYRLGGKTAGPELYDDGLTALERKYITEGKSKALAGAAKLRSLFVEGKGF
jgi:hypothetical protein